VKVRQAVEGHARREADKALDKFMRRLEQLAQDWGETTATPSSRNLSEESKRDSHLVTELTREVQLLEQAAAEIEQRLASRRNLVGGQRRERQQRWERQGGSGP
jgi:hypothetical protein